MRQIRIFSEYIHRIIESEAACCSHKKGEYIIRCGNCKFIHVPLNNSEPIWCIKHNTETKLNNFCSWAERRPYPLKIYRDNKWFYGNEYYEK